VGGRRAAGGEPRPAPGAPCLPGAGGPWVSCARQAAQRHNAGSRFARGRRERPGSATCLGGRGRRRVSRAALELVVEIGVLADAHVDHRMARTALSHRRARPGRTRREESRVNNDGLEADLRSDLGQAGPRANVSLLHSRPQMLICSGSAAASRMPAGPPKTLSISGTITMPTRSVAAANATSTIPRPIGLDTQSSPLPPAWSVPREQPLDVLMAGFALEQTPCARFMHGDSPPEGLSGRPR
jgi:hypothetical protein